MSESATIDAPAGQAGDNAWRGLIGIASEFVFETDIRGRFVHADTRPSLAWPPGVLTGQDSAALLAGSPDVRGCDPFRPTAPVTGIRAWLRRGDGGVVCLSFTTAPIVDAEGRITGAHGYANDFSDGSPRVTRMTDEIRRADVLDRVLQCTGREVLAPRMIAAALETLVRSMGAEGAAVAAMPDGGVPIASYQTGEGVVSVLRAAAGSLEELSACSIQYAGTDRRPVLAACCTARFGDRAVLLIWRHPATARWDDDDRRLIGSAANIVRMVLDHEAIRRELSSRARHDPLTGLLNRAAFMEDVTRHASRLDYDRSHGTLIVAGMDSLQAVNDRLGHEEGDATLVRTAALMRRIVRPADLLGRLEGDRFGIWMNGADRLTAAERAEGLRDVIREEFEHLLGAEGPVVGLSMGIATRRPGSDEDLDSMVQRANQAMDAVKQGGRGHWRVSLREGD